MLVLMSRREQRSSFGALKGELGGSSADTRNENVMAYQMWKNFNKKYWQVLGATKINYAR